MKMLIEPLTKIILNVTPRHFKIDSKKQPKKK